MPNILSLDIFFSEIMLGIAMFLAMLTSIIYVGKSSSSVKRGLAAGVSLLILLGYIVLI